MLNQSEAALVEANLPLVRGIAANVSRFVPDADVDDLFADGLVGLLAAARSCDRDSLPRAWVALRARRAMIDGLRAARGHRWRVESDSLDREIGDDGGTAVDLLADDAADVADAAEARDLARRILALEPRRRFVLVARRRGLTDSETGSFLGISRHRVRELAIDAGRKLAA